MRKFYIALIMGLLAHGNSFAQNTAWPSPGGSENVGIGLLYPQSKLHLFSGGSSSNSTSQYSGDLIIQGGSTGRSAVTGASLEFVIPANTDGNNPWGQARIISVAGNGNSYNATGKLILGTRRMFDKGTGSGLTWNYGDDLVIDGAGKIGIGTNTPSVKFEVNSQNPGNGTSTVNWIAGSFGGQAGNRVVIGNLYGTPTIGGHNEGLNAWSNFAMNVEGGNVGIGTAYPDAKLAVKGTIHTQEVRVDMNGWADDVFKPTYHLPSLTAVEAYIDKNQHLPEVPSEQQVAREGINLGEMNKLLLKKVEELTLYLIEQNKQLKDQQKQINALKKGATKP